MLAALNLGGGEIMLILAACVAPLVLAGFIFWIWMLIHAIQNKELSDGEKIAWVLVILFLHFLGALIYLLVGRPKQGLRTAG